MVSDAIAKSSTKPSAYAFRTSSSEPIYDARLRAFQHNNTVRVHTKTQLDYA